MFENLLGQEAAARLSLDIRSKALPPSVLFSGPAGSGKGTAALELARVLSCDEGKALWNCTCHSCERHRTLSHPDLLILGPRAFQAEMAASAAAFLRDRGLASRLLFLRSVSKLQARFNPILWEGEEAKLGKAASLSSSLSEDIEDLGSLDGTDPEKLEKAVARILETAVKLEDEGVADAIPIAQIRRACAWAHLAPTKRKKVLLLENADRMQEGARNALLKILEEPPATCQIILTTARKGAMMPTLLSRLRPYTFQERPLAVEQEVIRRVFRDSPALEQDGSITLERYLESFLGVPRSLLSTMAAYFAASIVRSSQGRMSVVLSRLEKLSLERISGADLPPPPADSAAAIALVLEKAQKFQTRRLFPVFLGDLLSLTSCLQREAALGPGTVALSLSWSREISLAETSVITYNQNPALALERLFIALSSGGEVL